jgi:hypothetical protein
MEPHIRTLIWLLVPLLLFGGGITKESIAYKIYRNECAAKPQNLIHWNSGENFPSLGIGHFIWYPEGVHERFEESFPALIHFMEQKGVTVPAWLKGAAPWHDATQMQQDPRLPQLRDFLQRTMDLQATFMQKRSDDALHTMLKHLPAKARSILLHNYRRLRTTPQGNYILIDYRNFKGVGTDPHERYREKGWGLMQVLLCMSEDLPPQKAFVACARKLLQQRVENAPPARHEERWLRGWFNRLDTYLSK